MILYKEDVEKNRSFRWLLSLIAYGLFLWNGAVYISE